VPFGVLLALSTRVCLEPDRGVMLVLRNAETGDANSSRSRGPLPLMLRVDSARRARGVARVGAWCWGAGVRAAILGVTGGLFTARATVGCRWPAPDGRSYDGILAVVTGVDVVVGVLGFTVRSADVAFWSRDRSGWRGAWCVVVVVAAAGHAVAVVVMRAVLLPAAVVLVVNIPAEGFLLRTSGGESEVSAASARWYESACFDAAAFVVVDGGGGGIVSGGRLGNWGIPERYARCQGNPDSPLGRSDWSRAPSNYNTAHAVGLDWN
jgi:hypothetical protein